MKALRLCEDVLTSVGVDSPQLLEILLDGTFSDVLHHVAGQTLPSRPEDAAAPSVAKRRRADAQPEVLATKERRASEPGAAEDGRAVRVIRRANEVMEVNARRPERNTGSWVGPSGAVDVSLSWSSDTGRCVDASPVLLVREGADGKRQATAFVGSHSHRMQALDLDSGRLVWERVLGDRIEASAAVSRCGTLLVVGR